MCHKTKPNQTNLKRQLSLYHKIPLYLNLKTFIKFFLALSTYLPMELQIILLKAKGMKEFVNSQEKTTPEILTILFHQYNNDALIFLCTHFVVELSVFTNQP